MFCLAASQTSSVLPLVGDYFDARFCAHPTYGWLLVAEVDLFAQAMVAALFNGGDGLWYCRAYPPIFGECVADAALALGCAA